MRKYRNKHSGEVWACARFIYAATSSELEEVAFTADPNAKLYPARYDGTPYALVLHSPYSGAVPQVVAVKDGDWLACHVDNHALITITDTLMDGDMTEVDEDTSLTMRRWFGHAPRRIHLIYDHGVDPPGGLEEDAIAHMRAHMFAEFGSGQPHYHVREP